MSPSGLVSRMDVLRELESFVTDQLGLLTLPEKCWQPSDFLPDMAADDWLDQLAELRRTAALLPDDLLVSLIGNVLTEEALPSYHSWLSNLENGLDRTGVGTNALALWTRGWVAEEQRHGDGLTKYLYLSGRVDQKAVERTLQNLIRSGFDPGTRGSIYLGFVYTSFQERATQISHANVASLARGYGCEPLACLCEAIAGDEARHERAYSRFVGRLIELDPDGTLLAFEEMMRTGIIMPSKTMSDDRDPDLYALFSAVAQRSGMYTVRHYAGIVERLIRVWHIEALTPATPEGRAAQDFLGRLTERMWRLVDRVEKRALHVPNRPLSWLYGRTLGTGHDLAV